MLSRHNYAERYPSGRLKPLSAKDRAKIARRRADEILSVVLAQPHRRGAKDPRDPLLECPLGRFVRRHKMNEAIYRAGLAYSDLVRKWRRAREIPVELRVVGESSGHIPDAKAVDAWQTEIERIELGVARASMGLQIMRNLILDEQEPPEYADKIVYTALAELARQMGYLQKKYSSV